MRRATDRWLRSLVFLLAWNGAQGQQLPSPERSGATPGAIPGGTARDATAAPATHTEPARRVPANTRPEPTGRGSEVPRVPRVGGSLIGRSLPAPVNAAPAIQAGQMRHEPGEILTASPDLDSARALHRQLAKRDIRLRSRHVLKQIGLVLSRFQLPQGRDAAAELAALRLKFPDVTFDLNHLYQTQSAEPRRYGQHLVGADADNRGCGRGVRIGLVDTAVDTRHPALRGRPVVRRVFLAAGETPAQADHGTAIAALLLGAPQGSPLAGLVPAAELIVAAVFRTRNGAMDTSAARIVRGLDYLAGMDARVVNLSLAGSDNRLLRRAVAQLERQGRVLVAAVGNSGPDSPPRFPAALPGVIAVTAVDAQLRVFDRAARGREVDLAGPGVDVWVARAGGGSGFASGTSYAAPFVTALAARLLTGAPSLSPTDIRARLQHDARDLGPPGRDTVYGAGLVQTPAGPCRPLSE